MQAAIKAHTKLNCRITRPFRRFLGVSGGDTCTGGCITVLRTLAKGVVGIIVGGITVEACVGEVPFSVGLRATICSLLSTVWWNTRAKVATESKRCVGSLAKARSRIGSSCLGKRS